MEIIGFFFFGLSLSSICFKREIPVLQSAAIYRSSDSSQVPPVGLETIFRSTRQVTEIFNEKIFFFWEKMRRLEKSAGG